MTHMNTLPIPVKTEGRSCFGIAYFATEVEADRYAAFVQARNDRYNGGYFDGMRCGRDTGFDHVDDSGRLLYAVTTR
jgi:hypothetical protein